MLLSLAVGPADKPLGDLQGDAHSECRQLEVRHRASLRGETLVPLLHLNSQFLFYQSRFLFQSEML